MSEHLTDRIRAIVSERYIKPARRAGKTSVVVRVRDVKAEMSRSEPMRGKSVVICQALQSRKMLADNHLGVEKIDGPPSKKSPTVVMHYALLDDPNLPTVRESSAERAFRLTEKLRGLMKDEIAAHGGGEAYLRWVRGEDEAE